MCCALRGTAPNTYHIHALIFADSISACLKFVRVHAIREGTQGDRQWPSGIVLSWHLICVAVPTGQHVSIIFAFTVVAAHHRSCQTAARPGLQHFYLGTREVPNKRALIARD
jgi:hypothetical protein